MFGRWLSYDGRRPDPLGELSTLKRAHFHSLGAMPCLLRFGSTRGTPIAPAFRGQNGSEPGHARRREIRRMARVIRWVAFLALALILPTATEACASSGALGAKGTDLIVADATALPPTLDP